MVGQGEGLFPLDKSQSSIDKVPVIVADCAESTETKFEQVDFERTERGDEHVETHVKLLAS